MTARKESQQRSGTDNGVDTPKKRGAMTYVLWTIQVLLALLFLFAGVVKLVTSIESLSGPLALPGWFIRFIGVAEALGALGLVLPGLLRIRVGLTPLAAVGLFIIMIGAVVITLMTAGVAQALTPFVTGLLLAFVAYGRRRNATQGKSGAFRDAAARISLITNVG